MFNEDNVPAGAFVRINVTKKAKAVVAVLSPDSKVVYVKPNPKDQTNRAPHEVPYSKVARVYKTIDAARGDKINRRADTTVFEPSGRLASLDEEKWTSLYGDALSIAAYNFDTVPIGAVARIRLSSTLNVVVLTIVGKDDEKVFVHPHPKKDKDSLALYGAKYSKVLKLYRTLKEALADPINQVPSTKILDPRMSVAALDEAEWEAIYGDTSEAEDIIDLSQLSEPALDFAIDLLREPIDSLDLSILNHHLVRRCSFKSRLDRDYWTVYRQNIQKTLSCGAICGFGLPRFADRLLKLRQVSLIDLSHYLVFNERNDPLAAIIRRPGSRGRTGSGAGGSDYRYRIVYTAYIKFLKTLRRSCRYGRPSSNRIKWIVPTPQMRRHIYSSNDDVWCHWMPLAVVQLLRRWQPRRINSLRIALSRLADDIKRQHVYFPWDPKFNLETRFIPIHALYQYEPSSLTLGGIKALHNCGLTSINDLRCLHPDAVAAAKDPTQPLLRLS